LTRLTAVFIALVFLMAIACSGDPPASVSRPVVTATTAADIAPAGVIAAAEGRLPDGRYFGRLLQVETRGAVFHFLPVCVGDTNPTLRTLATEEQTDTPLRAAPSAQLFIYRPVRQGDVASGSFRTVGIADIAQVVQNDSASRWWVPVSRNTIQRIEQDSGLHVADGGCPR
jgi:hypothetical protein